MGGLSNVLEVMEPGRSGRDLYHGTLPGMCGALRDTTYLKSDIVQCKCLNLKELFTFHYTYRCIYRSNAPGLSVTHCTLRNAFRLLPLPNIRSQI